MLMLQSWPIGHSLVMVQAAPAGMPELPPFDAPAAAPPPAPADGMTELLPAVLGPGALPPSSGAEVQAPTDEKTSKPRAAAERMRAVLTVVFTCKFLCFCVRPGWRPS